MVMIQQPLRHPGARHRDPLREPVQFCRARVEAPSEEIPGSSPGMTAV